MCFLVGGWVVLGTIFFFFFVLVFDYGDGVQCKDLYLLVKQKVEDSISLLKRTREKDPVCLEKKPSDPIFVVSFKN
jgi:hypothetical protein